MDLICSNARACKEMLCRHKTKHSRLSFGDKDYCIVVPCEIDSLIHKNICCIEMIVI